MIGQYWLLVMGIWNIVVFLLYGIDKWKAKRNKWRISEMCLLGTALCFGGIGAFVGMIVFHHKTRKWKFRILVPVFAMLHAAVIYGIMR